MQISTNKNENASNEKEPENLHLIMGCISVFYDFEKQRGCCFVLFFLNIDIQCVSFVILAITYTLIGDKDKRFILLGL